MKNIVYIKKLDKYNEILNKEYKKIPTFLKRLIYIYKNTFNIITKKTIEGNNIWILPVQEDYSINKITKQIKKLAFYKENIYVLSEDINNLQIRKVMNENNVNYLKSEVLKQYLVVKTLNHIIKIQNEKINNIDITVLIRNVSELNLYIIEELSKMVKSIKIVTPNIYKFKKLEENLYIKYGIAIQFSNSYKKSLSKSRYIINLDFSLIDINEYVIFNKAVIINCKDESIKIKSKLFNGVIVNSYNIKFKKEIRDKFRKINIYHKYNSLLLYESYIFNKRNIAQVIEQVNQDKVTIIELIGTNGNINKCELKNLTNH